jgi:5-methylcytosine-specific restriction endonuclease McrA
VKTKSKTQREKVVFIFAGNAKPEKRATQTAINNDLVMTCIICGKPRRQWDAAKRSRDNSKYCSDKCKASRAKHRVPILKSTWNAVMKRDHHRCRYCGAKAAHVDHVIPYSKGGGDDIQNLVAACVKCNCSVNDRAFKSFDDKRAWILRQRGLVVDDVEIETVNLPRRADWRTWVYGGMKSLRNKVRKP